MEESSSDAERGGIGAQDPFPLIVRVADRYHFLQGHLEAFEASDVVLGLSGRVPVEVLVRHFVEMCREGREVRDEAGKEVGSAQKGLHLLDRGPQGRKGHAYIHIYKCIYACPFRGFEVGKGKAAMESLRS